MSKPGPAPLRNAAAAQANPVLDYARPGRGRPPVTAWRVLAALTTALAVAGFVFLATLYLEVASLGSFPEVGGLVGTVVFLALAVALAIYFAVRVFLAFLRRYARKTPPHWLEAR